MESIKSYEEFLDLIDDFLGELKSKSSEEGSLELYLANYITKLSENCHRSSSAREVRDSVKSVVHFATDSLDWDSEFYKKITQIADYHSGLIREAK